MTANNESFQVAYIRPYPNVTFDDFCSRFTTRLMPLLYSTGPDWGFALRDSSLPRP